MGGEPNFSIDCRDAGGFESECRDSARNSRRVFTELLLRRSFRERLAKFGLELHPEKTRLIQFGRFAVLNRKEQGQGKPETFTFLGFTHYCGKRRKDGAFIVWRETAKKRLVAKLHEIKLELTRLRHEPIVRVGEWLRKVSAGYYQYHAVPGNVPQLNRSVGGSAGCGGERSHAVASAAAFRSADSIG
jgi:hypothetical protein